MTLPGQSHGLQFRLGKYSAAYRKRLIQAGRSLCRYVGSSAARWLIEAASASEVDSVLAQFVEHMRSQRSKGSLKTAKHAALLMQIIRPRLHRRLNETWFVLRAWEEQTPSRLRMPLPVPVFLAMVIYSRVKALQSSCSTQRSLWFAFATILELAFYGLLRPGEALGIECRDVSLPNSLSLGQPHLTLTLRDPKNRRQLGRLQHAVVKHPHACNWASWVIGSSSQTCKLWPSSQYHFRRRFKEVCRALRVHNWHLTPASLRAGGATFLFQQGCSVDRLRFQGRWTSLASLEHYVQVGVAQQTLLQVQPACAAKIRRYLQLGSFLLELGAKYRAEVPSEQLVSTPALCFTQADNPVSWAHGFAAMGTQI